VRWFWPLMIVGCGQTEFAQQWQLDRVRLLAARGEVVAPPDPVLGSRAEPRPGETLQFSSLRYAPEDVPPVGAMWIGCLTTGSSQTGCELDESAFQDLEDLDEDASPAELAAAFERLTEAGFLGFEPDWPPMMEVPADALDGVEDRLEGISAFVNITLMAKEEEGADDPEMGFKRIAVSEATSPNHNPDIEDILVAGESLGGAKGFTARTGRTYILEPVLPEGHIETYSYINSQGEEEWRVEQPFFTWYTETGPGKMGRQASFDQAESLYPFSAVEWTAPKTPGWIEIDVVVRDRRGGMGWRTLEVNVL